MIVRRNENQPGGIREVTLQIIGGTGGARVLFTASDTMIHEPQRGRRFLSYTFKDKRLCCLAAIEGISTVSTVEKVLAIVRQSCTSGEKSALTKLEKSNA